MAAATYGIRPEHLRLVEEGQGLPFKVTVVEPTGSETHVLGRLGAHQMLGVFRERVSATPGSTLHLLPDPALAHLFDGQGKRVN